MCWIIFSKILPISVSLRKLYIIFVQICYTFIFINLTSILFILVLKITSFSKIKIMIVFLNRSTIILILMIFYLFPLLKSFSLIQSLIILFLIMPFMIFHIIPNVHLLIFVLIRKQSFDLHSFLI